MMTINFLQRDSVFVVVSKIYHNSLLYSCGQNYKGSSCVTSHDTFMYTIKVYAKPL